NNTQEPYHDSPSSSRSSTPASSNRIPQPKPLPSLPAEAPIEPPVPYRDEPSPSSPTFAPVIASPTPQRHRSSTTTSTRRLQHAEIQLFYTPYSDVPPAANDEDVPLAHLYPYPTEAPPSYQVAVRESYRETLVQHIPNSAVYTAHDEEAGIEEAQADDVRFTVEKFVAAIIVSMVLLIIASFLALIAISGFNWKI
ncbi:hypothetical protein GRF29_69g1450678, partial [Pseudopithomyces chartarum]